MKAQEALSIDPMKEALKFMTEFENLLVLNFSQPKEIVHQVMVVVGPHVCTTFMNLVVKGRNEARAKMLLRVGDVLTAILHEDA